MVLIDTYPTRFGLNLSSIIARRLVGARAARHRRMAARALRRGRAGLVGRPIDFLFIDGDHAYEAVRRDFEDWSRHVTADGVLLFHDALHRRVLDGPELRVGPLRRGAARARGRMAAGRLGRSLAAFKRA